MCLLSLRLLCCRSGVSTLNLPRPLLRCPPNSAARNARVSPNIELYQHSVGVWDAGTSADGLPDSAGGLRAERGAPLDRVVVLRRQCRILLLRGRVHQARQKPQGGVIKPGP